MKKRIFTAILAGIFFLTVAIIGGTAFSVLAVLMALVGYAELLQMRKIKTYSFPAAIGFILVIMVVSGLNVGSLSTAELFIIAFLLLLVYTVFSKNVFHFDQVSFMMIAALYVSVGFHYMIQARGNGMAVLFFILFSVWATDTVAYFAGRSFGKRKLWPEISPKKTVEGSIGGIIATLVVAVLYQVFLPVYPSIGFAIAAGLVITVFGQLGDLVESAFKRHYGVKDSGALLPGHGGILDRFDSLLFVLPILHILNLI